jgi:CheY-like chemotaxis protein
MGENLILADVHQVFDGFEALAFLRRYDYCFKNAPRPDLILLDLSMPRMSGFECLTIIKQDAALSDIPVVVLSTSHSKEDMTESLRLGAVDYFTKPMDIHQLKETIRVLGERWIIPHSVNVSQSANK